MSKFSVGTVFRVAFALAMPRGRKLNELAQSARGRSGRDGRRPTQGSSRSSDSSSHAADSEANHDDVEAGSRPPAQGSDASHQASSEGSHSDRLGASTESSYDYSSWSSRRARPRWKINWGSIKSLFHRGDDSYSETAAKSSRFWNSNWIPFIGYHHVLMVMLVMAIIFLSVLLGGCTQEGLRHVYLLSLVYTGATSPTSDTAQVDTQYAALMGGLVPGNITNRLEIRVGYFGFCLMDAGPALPPVICSSNLGDVAASIAVVDNGIADPLNLLWAAKSFHDSVIFSGLVFISIIFALASFLLLGTFPGWHHEIDDEGSERLVKPFPRRSVSNLVVILVTFSGLFCFVSALWQHLSVAATVAMTQVFTYGFASGHVGTAAMVFGWLGTGLILVVAIAVLLMILSSRMLDMIADSSTTSDATSISEILE